MEAAAIPAEKDFGLVYMDDNGPIHRAGVVCDWKRNYGVQVLEWPPYSPDLNPIENA